jgi:N-acetylmuramoyl-L-alanine amidase
VPHTLRRAFVIVLVLVALGLIAYVLLTNTNAVSLPKLLTAAQPASPPGSSSAAVNDMRIGIVSGHRGNDSGTVCQDGLTEAQVNFDIATRVAELLRTQGYTVDVLDEFDPRLKGYRAITLLSIHADSCTYINDMATGFKVARVYDSMMPEEEDRLVACISARYKAYTGLRFDANTVTADMTKYHTFYEINPQTPAAIIETGFLYLDRDILTHKPELVAQGIYDGILCFLNNEQPKPNPGVQ